MFSQVCLLICIFLMIRTSCQCPLMFSMCECVFHYVLNCFMNYLYAPLFLFCFHNVSMHSHVFYAVIDLTCCIAFSTPFLVFVQCVFIVFIFSSFFNDFQCVLMLLNVFQCVLMFFMFFNARPDHVHWRRMCPHQIMKIMV